ncbi:hypothetical protein Tco_0304617 [Tanacetum coccineum]
MDKKKSSKDVEPSKGLKSKESKSSSSSKGTQSQPKSSGKSTQAEEPEFDKPDKPPTPNRAWNKSKSIDTRDRHINEITPFCKSISPPRTFNELMDTPIRPSQLLWVDVQVVPTDYFINNDLEYLKGGSSCSKYVTSTTRTKAAKYDNVEGIEDMVLTLWSPVKVANNKHVVWGTYHWGPKQQRFYAYACHWKSPHDVYSKRRIIVVTSVKVMRWYDYGYLEEIVVRRDDNVLYKFKEGDFPRLNLCDIEDMLLLLVQKKLSNLDVDDRHDLGHPLLPRDLLSRQIQKRTGLILRSDELYKFCNGTLSSVRRVLQDIASNLEMDYLPKRHWSNMEIKRSHIMVKAIDKLLFERSGSNGYVTGFSGNTEKTDHLNYCNGVKGGLSLGIHSPDPAPEPEGIYPGYPQIV